MKTGIQSFGVPVSLLEVSRKDIECALGYIELPPPDYLPEMIDAALEHVRTLLDVRCGYSIIAGPDFELMPTCIRCRSVQLNTGTVIAKRLRRSSSVAIFAASIGRETETEAKRRMEAGDMMSGFVYDTIGSVYAEAAADAVERTIGSSAAASSEAITNRYSPGYCDWNVAGQHALFSLLPPGFCGISLTPSALMLPVKSVSGIIGIGAMVKREEYQCSICDMDDCIRKKFVDAKRGGESQKAKER